MTDRPTVAAASRASRSLDRRAALARLGIAAGVAYIAPTILELDRSANAKVLPTPCPPPHARGRGGRGGGRGCRRR